MIVWVVCFDCCVEISFREGSMVGSTAREKYRRVPAMDLNRCVTDEYSVCRYGSVCAYWTLDS